MTSLADVSRLLAAGDASPLEILDACLSRLPEAQEHGAFVHIDEDGARRAAEADPVDGGLNRDGSHVSGHACSLPASSGYVVFSVPGASAREKTS